MRHKNKQLFQEFLKDKIPFHLNLKKQWFDLIVSGKKREEYREIKPYWENRLCHKKGFKINGEWFQPDQVVIIFSNGYRKDRKQIACFPNAIKIKKGKTDWGAKEGKLYFAIQLSYTVLKIKAMSNDN